MKFILSIILSIAAISSFAQQTINGTIMHDGLQRDYILYVPASYSSGTDAPLIMNFHGYTSNATQQMFYGDFTAIADTAGFIVVHPEGTLDLQGQTHWNAGWGGATDDLGFTEALIDSLAADYSINLDRVYSTGMSNGGFMSYFLACNLSNRIAAIASVTGSMSVGQIPGCNPQHPVPVMEIHGTADPTVPYTGGAGVESVDNVVDHWVGFNNCDAAAIVTNVPDIASTDGCTAEHSVYKNGDNGVEVELYKIVGGGHTWPGAPIDIGVTSHDFHGSTEIWRFFSQYDINGRIGTVGVNEVTEKVLGLRIYPNPVSDVLTINAEGFSFRSIKIVNALGVEMTHIDGNNKDAVTVSLHNWSKGMYFVEAQDQQGDSVISRFVIATTNGKNQ